MNYPCKDCEFRHTACWGDCEVYKAYKKQVEDERAKRVKSENAKSFLYECYIRQMRKQRKR